MHLSILVLVYGAGDETEGQPWSAVGRRRVAVHGVRRKATQEAPLVQVSVHEVLIPDL